MTLVEAIRIRVKNELKAAFIVDLGREPTVDDLFKLRARADKITYRVITEFEDHLKGMLE